MTRTHYYQTAANILGRIQFATLATVSAEGQPWNTPVWAMHDEYLNFYWFSDKESQHSRNVRQNGAVFIVVYDSTASAPGDRRGLYLQAHAYELNDPEEIRTIRRKKKGRGNDDPAEFMGSAVRRVYKAVPQRAWVNDVQTENGIFIRDYRKELSLSQLRRKICS